MAENYNGSQVLPDTDPNQLETAKAEVVVSYWGTLYQLTDRGRCSQSVPFILSNEVYTVGRAPTCDLVILEADFYQNKFTQISKIHFKIEQTKIENIIFLEDLSVNGTFVNGLFVGKNRKVPLENGAVISLADPNLKMYLYSENPEASNRNKWLDPTLCNKFHVLSSLGSGSFGDVKLVLHQESGQLLAIKKILKDKMPEKRIQNEVNILKLLSHPCIVQLVDIFDAPEAVFITLEYVRDGNLLHRITRSEAKRLEEYECKVIFYQLVLGVKYLHSEGITHRDLKPENILLDILPNGKDVLVKITDFGLSKMETDKTQLKTNCGTMTYKAPEVLAMFAPTYSNKVDIWSLGIILYFCLSGTHPFKSNGGNPIHLAQQILNRRVDFPSHLWLSISSDAKSVIKDTLITIPLKRISLDGILKHRWLQDQEMRDHIDYLINERSVDDLKPVLKKPKMS